jgi:hypothetical protein
MTLERSPPEVKLGSCTPLYSIQLKTFREPAVRASPQHGIRPESSG